MNDSTVRLAIRVFLHGVLQSVELMAAEVHELDELLPKLAEKHASVMVTAPGMVEIEFPR